MKIAINQRPYDGPWGGGNRFLQAIVRELEGRGHVITHELSGPIDIILMVETRIRSPNVTFDAGGILRYLLRHPDTVVVHRINECDERKGERFITHKLLRANYAADLTVFVGSWLLDLPAWRDKDRARCAVILNGADRSVFNSDGFTPWPHNGPIRLVTHHWGSHRYKGFDVYEAVDALLDRPDFAQRFEMSYIGNLPKGYMFRNVRHVSPLNGRALADALRSHHAYVTGSINEPGGNHQNEGALCGLPLIYRRSGCLPEYCDGYGLSFDGPRDIEGALETLHAEYDQLAERVKSYPHDAATMARSWCAFFEDVHARRKDLVSSRRPWRNPSAWLRNQVPL